MRLFKRKEKKVIPIQFLDTQLKTSTCPPLLDLVNLCVCVSCPKKGTCYLERVHNLMGCQRFVRTCSLKNTIVSPGIASDFPKIALDEFYAHIYLKYLNCNNPSELKEEEIKSAKEKSN